MTDTLRPNLYFAATSIVGEGARPWPVLETTHRALKDDGKFGEEVYAHSRTQGPRAMASFLKGQAELDRRAGYSS